MARAVGPIPVGVTVARKRHEALQRQSQQQSDGSVHAISDSDDLSTQQIWEDHPGDMKHLGNTSWRVFLEACAIYVACVFSPTLIGYLLDLYRAYQSSQSALLFEETLPAEKSWTEYYTELASYAKDETQNYLCASTEDSQSWAYFLGASWMCVPKENPNARVFLWSPDAQWTDLGTVAFLSLTLAAIRLLILLVFVPLKEPDRLSAVIRCKSIHLLSRDYQLTPNGTPKISRKPAAPLISGADLSNLQLPDLAGRNDVSNTGDYDDNSHLGLSLDDTQEDDIPFEEMSPPPPLPSPAPPIDEMEFPSEVENPSIVINDRVEGFNSGPRLATASFRLVYSGLVAAVAFYFFSSYEFWPVHVGGTGKTAKCWDLSGGLSVGGVDGDFDAHNTALRRYYLQQASYHWHSGAFHLLSVLVVLTRPREKRLDWIRDSTSSYSRSFLQHSVAILLLSTTYVFSSLRRLGAIGMFSFDVSSFFLHLLQVCMNSPKSTLLRNTRLIGFIYRFLVLPSFVHCRFVVWPVLWWSALMESKKWLAQLDRILFPGASLWLQALWHSCMLGAMVLNGVYLRRLLNHPHLSRIIRSRNLEQ